MSGGLTYLLLEIAADSVLYRSAQDCTGSASYDAQLNVASTEEVIDTFFYQGQLRTPSGANSAILDDSSQPGLLLVPQEYAVTLTFDACGFDTYPDSSSLAGDTLTFTATSYGGDQVVEVYKIRPAGGGGITKQAGSVDGSLIGTQAHFTR